MTHEFKINQIWTDHFFRSKWLYGFLSLAFLWIWGGGDLQYFAMKSIVAGILLYALLWPDLKKLTPELKNQKQIKLALLASLPVFGVLMGLLYFALNTEISPLMGGFITGWFHKAYLLLLNTTFFDLVACVFFVPAWALVSRSILQDDWGLGGVAFLDAMTIGMAAQNAGVFFFVYAGGYLWGFSKNRIGLGFSVWFQTLCMVHLFLAVWAASYLF